MKLVLKLGSIRIMSLDISNNPKTREVYSLMFIVDMGEEERMR